MNNEDGAWLVAHNYSTERLNEFTDMVSANFEHGLEEDKCREIAVRQLRMEALNSFKHSIQHLL